MNESPESAGGVERQHRVCAGRRRHWPPAGERRRGCGDPGFAARVGMALEKPTGEPVCLQWSSINRGARKQPVHTYIKLCRIYSYYTYTLTTSIHILHIQDRAF